MLGKWSQITRENVIEAIEKYNQNNEYFYSKNTFLVYDGKMYPAKHIRALAYEIAHGEAIEKSTFTGGKETANFFERLGFDVSYNPKITKKSDKVKTKHGTKKEKNRKVISQKDVTDQKNKLQLHLNQVFSGDVVCEKTFDWMKTPNNNNFDLTYEKVSTALIEYRGHKNIGRSDYKLRCDFVCQSEKIIIEYDERQHFSEARKISLINYPEEIAVFYSLESWIESCEKIAAKDNHPANRDEIRAYYDSVRDIESYRNGYKLIRIRHGDFDWNRKDGDEYLKEILKFKPITSNTNNSATSLLEYDWRSLEVELQRVRVQYLKWLYNFKPIPCDALDAIIYDNKVLVVDSPLGRSFSLSPAGAGSVYVGGGKGVQGLLKGSYQEDELLRKESSHIKQSLNQKVRELRKHIRMLLKMKRYADVWEHIQNFWWLRLGIHEFVFDMNFGPSPMPTNSVRNYVLAAIYNKIDLSSEVPNSFSDEEIVHSLRYTFSWNRFANCSYDCGPIVVGKDRYIPYREAAQQVREYFQSNNSKVGELKNRNEKRDFAASSLAENHDFLLLYHKEPVGFITLDQFHEKKNVLRTHIENIEEKLQNIELQEGLNLG